MAATQVPIHMNPGPPAPAPAWVNPGPPAPAPAPPAPAPPAPAPPAPAPALAPVDPRAVAFARVMGLVKQTAPASEAAFTQQCQAYGTCPMEANGTQAQVNRD